MWGKKFFATLLAGLTAVAVTSTDASACTVMLVTKGVSVDGSVLVAHSNDGFSNDPNVAFVPAKNHPKGSKRPVYPTAAALSEIPEYNCFNQPHLVAPERSDDYNFPGKPHTKPLGYITQVEHTYAYIDGDYSIMNEHGLMLGECTDTSAYLRNVPYTEGGGIFYQRRAALECCKTAREAVELMGTLIDEYGLWGTAETLTARRASTLLNF